MEKQYKVRITKYAMEQMEETKRYIADKLLAQRAAYNLFLEMKNSADSFKQHAGT